MPIKNIRNLLPSLFRQKIQSLDNISLQRLTTLNSRYFRHNDYRIVGNKVDIGQGCIFVGTPDQILESYGFETCAPLIMLTGKDGKKVLGHIDDGNHPREIVKTIRKHFAPKEIENASFHYFKGAETISAGENLAHFAVDVIEKALKLLGVKGNYHGQLGSSDVDIVIVDLEGIKIKRHEEIIKIINI